MSLYLCAKKKAFLLDTLESVILHILDISVDYARILLNTFRPYACCHKANKVL